MQTCDALVVGGGPAGSTCARRLRQHGLDVVVMDKAAFPRDKVCAGWITPEVIATLELDMADYARRLVIQPVRGFRTGLIGGGAVETRYPETVSFGIRRREFDDYLLRRTGARLELGQPLRTLERNGSGWKANGSLCAPVVIGAGGHFCPVARLAGARLGSEEAALAAKELEFELIDEQLDECTVAAEMPELYFTRELDGYGWCFRKGRHLNIGLGCEVSHGLTARLEHFCDFLRRQGRIPRDIPDRFKGHAYLVYGRGERRLFDDGVLLVGDAAGLAYPQSGEGIRPAVESGLMAAATIVDACQDYSAARLAAYAERITARFGNRSAPRRRSPRWLQRPLATALMASHWFTRRVILDRWFLHRHQGPLATG